MQRDFWRQRWREGRLGFHQQKVNSRLRKLWDIFELAKGERVLVPLCGKSLDMLWLAQQGYPVFGVEISDLACRDFYAENNLQYRIVERNGSGDSAHDKAAPPVVRFIGADIELWCGDFFALQADEMRDIRVAYDRAALIALPAAMRRDYVAHLAALLQPGAQVLLLSMDYDESKMKGPPFSVAENEVRDLFEYEFCVEILAQSSGPDIVGNLAERGLDTLNEKVYRMTRVARAASQR